MFSTFPSPTTTGVLALGPQWLAYPSWQPLGPADPAAIAPANTFGSCYMDLGVGVAGTCTGVGFRVEGVGCGV